LQQDEKEEALGRRLVEENRKLWAVAGPSICTRFSTFGVTVISQAFVGHIGPTELAAYALVSTVLMRFSNGILVINQYLPNLLLISCHAIHPPPAYNLDLHEVNQLSSVP
jgi:MATE family multidrug resistance protein